MFTLRLCWLLFRLLFVAKVVWPTIDTLCRFYVCFHGDDDPALSRVCISKREDQLLNELTAKLPEGRELIQEIRRYTRVDE